MNNILVSAFILAGVIFSGCSSTQNTEVTGENLKNTRWVLRELKSVTVTDTKQDIYIIFNINEDKFNGYGGCNKFFGNYRYDGTTLKLLEIGSTKMFCAEDKYEISFFDVLKNFDEHKIGGKNLYLYRSGKVVAKFEAVFL